MKKAVLITGAAGQTGKQALLEYANGEKANYVVLNDIPPEFRLPGLSGEVVYSAIRADLKKLAELEKITKVLQRFAGEEILILDIGALFRYTASWQDLYEANVTGQKNLVEHVALPLQDFGKKVKLIFWGAAALYGEFNNPNFLLPAKENYSLDPKSDYAKTKQIAEDLLLDYHRREGLWVSIMRCGAIYAEGGTYGMSGAICLMLLGMLEPMIVGDGKNRVAFVHARDTVRIADFLTSQEEANGKVFNVRDNSIHTLEEVIATQCEAVGTRAFKHAKIPEKLFKKMISEPTGEKAKDWGVNPVIDTELAKMTTLDSYIDITALKSLFEKAGVNFESYLMYPDTLEGLKQVIGWYRDNWKEWIGYYV